MSTLTIPQRLLMGPGPTNTPQSVLDALAQPTIGHLDPVFIRLMDDIKSMLRQTFLTENPLTLPVSAPGSAGMEACFVNLLEPGDKVVLAINGVFGKRMLENILRCGAEPTVVEFEWGQPVDPERIEQALKQQGQVKLLAFVHAETSTGAISNARELCALARQYDCLSLVDTVTSWCGTEVAVDRWQADAVYSGTQKCLGAMPGISPVSFSAKAVEAIKARQTPVQSWFLDMNLVMQYWQEDAPRVYHHTAPVNSLYGLYEALRLVLDEGLETRWKRHSNAHALLVQGLEELGLQMLVEQPARLPMLNAVKVPPGVDEAQVRQRLLQDHGIEIGAGLGPLAGKVWRIGLMGDNASEERVSGLLSALAEVLK